MTDITVTKRGRGRPRKGTVEDRAGEIVAAAFIHFGTHGFAGARLEEIARTAGVSRAALYHHFKTKQDLYAVSALTAAYHVLPAYRAALASEATLLDQVRALVRSAVDMNERYPTVTPFLAAIPLELRRHPELQPLLDGVITEVAADLSAVFAKARSRGEIAPNVKDADLYLALVGTLMGIGLLALGPEAQRLDRTIDVLIRALEKLITA